MKLRAAVVAVLAATGIALTTTPATAAPTRYEAETAPASCNGTIDTNHAGYSGTGFCNASNAVGATAQFTVSAPTAGTATLGVRFANGTAATRSTDVVVNGTRVATTTFDGNGAPTDANIQYYGRWDRTNASYYSMGWAGGYLDAQFTGGSIGVRQRNAIDLYYSIDRGPLTWRRNVSGNVTLATGLSGTSHSIRIGYREKAGSYTGDPVFGGLILASGGQTARISRPANFIEFIGDSFTVGQPTPRSPRAARAWSARTATE
jgi:hypothetical protein